MAMEGDQNIFTDIFSVIFLLSTVFSMVACFFMLKRFQKNLDAQCVVSELKRFNLVGSGELNCYLFHYISFVYGNIQGALILGTIIVLMLISVRNQKALLYSPFLDIFGYKILEGKITSTDTPSTFSMQARFLVRTDQGLYFTSKNYGRANKIGVEKMIEKKEREKYDKYFLYRIPKSKNSV